MAEFPISIDEVTEPWLTESLRASGVLGPAGVSDFRAELIGEGVGLMGLLYRLHLRYDGDSGGPATVVLKVATTDPAARHVARTFRFYEKEVGFYQDFADHTPVTTTACFAAHHDPEADDFVLLFSDVGNARTYSQTEGCPPEVAMVAARALARHHAAFADSPLFDRPEHAWLPYAADPRRHHRGDHRLVGAVSGEVPRAHRPRDRIHRCALSRLGA